MQRDNEVNNMRMFLEETTGRKFSFDKLNATILNYPEPGEMIMKYAYALKINYPDEPPRLTALRERFFKFYTQSIIVLLGCVDEKGKCMICRRHRLTLSQSEELLDLVAKLYCEGAFGTDSLWYIANNINESLDLNLSLRTIYNKLQRKI